MSYHYSNFETKVPTIQILRQKCPLFEFFDKATPHNLNNILIIVKINLELDLKSDNHFHGNSVQFNSIACLFLSLELYFELELKFK